MAKSNRSVKIKVDGLADLSRAFATMGDATAKAMNDMAVSMAEAMRETVAFGSALDRMHAEIRREQARELDERAAALHARADALRDEVDTIAPTPERRIIVRSWPRGR